MALFGKRGGHTISYEHVTHEPGEPILTINRVGMTFDGNEVLSDISFSLKEGQRVALVGPNGAGKSTLFQIIAGILSPTKGEVKVFGHGPSGHICIAYVPQRSMVDASFPVTVFDVVMMGRAGKLGLLSRPGRVDRDFVRQCLQTVGLEGKEHLQLSELSGGQQQRTFIARALAQEAELMALDEPFTGLDLPAQERLFEVLDQMEKFNVTVMMSLHDLNLTVERCDEVILINKTIIAKGKPAEVYSADNLAHAFGGQVRLVQTDNGISVFSNSCGLCDGGSHE